jgi:hypothetical protein
MIHICFINRYSVAAKTWTHFQGVHRHCTLLNSVTVLLTPRFSKIQKSIKLKPHNGAVVDGESSSLAFEGCRVCVV